MTLGNFNKSAGYTVGENRLAQLAERSFLKMWSWPNLYREAGKELCDLLAVMGNEVIIFSHKGAEFNFNKGYELGWKRWFREILSAGKQVYGAEKHLRNKQTRLFTDVKCQNLLPLSLPDTEKIKIHRVVIASGARQACVNYFNGGSGSIPINTAISGLEHINNDSKPFYIGKLDSKGSYIHVFDDVTFETIFKELDTFKDFTDYLSAKEKLVGMGKEILATGEEELLGLYLKNIDSEGKHWFFDSSEDIESATGVFVPEGVWDDIFTYRSWR